MLGMEVLMSSYERYCDLDRKLHGRFYLQIGRYLWDVGWDVEHNWYHGGVHLHTNVATHYLGGGTSQGRAPSEFLPEVADKIEVLRRRMDAWVNGAEFEAPEWATKTFFDRPKWVPSKRPKVA